MRGRRGFAAFLGLAVAASAAVIPQAASASSGQSVADKTTTSLAGIVSELVGRGVTVSNVSYSGDDRAVGVFSGMRAAVGLDSGVALSTGRVSQDLPGPHGAKLSTSFGGSGDADLSTLVGGASVQDAASLEFDFVPRTSSLSIDYLFGSAEYNKYVGGKYNDVFGFFVNGQNCAVVEDTTPVTINSVNAGENANLFVDNTSGTHDTALNGFTKVLTCTAAVNAGQSNHVKIAIGDAGDDKLDSAVLIGAHGFVSNQAPTGSDSSFTLTAGTSVKIGFTGADDDGDPLSYAIVDQPKNGALTVSQSGAVYAPGPGFTGADSFRYTVSDGLVVSGPYTVSITVDQPVAPIPPIRDIRYTAVSGVDTPILLVPLDETAQTPSVTAASYVPTADTVVGYSITAAPLHGTLSGEGASKVYRSAADFIGADRFEYTSARSGVTSGPATVTLDVVARPVPPKESRSVPVFPPAPVQVGGQATSNDQPSAGPVYRSDRTDRADRTQKLAATGLDVDAMTGLMAVTLIMGVAVASLVAFRRRTAR